VLISLYQSPNTLVTQKIVAAHELYNSPYHPLGFPLIVNSKNQEYWLTLQSLYPKPGETVVLDTSSQTLISVYFPDKKQLLSHPGQLISWFIGKISEPFTSSRFWMQTLCFLPLIILITYLHFIHPKKSLNHRK